MERKRHSTLVRKDCTATTALLPLSAKSDSSSFPGTSEGKDMEVDKTQLTSPLLLWKFSEKPRGAAINYALPLVFPGLLPAG